MRERGEEGMGEGRTSCDNHVQTRACRSKRMQKVGAPASVPASIVLLGHTGDLLPIEDIKLRIDVR